MDFIPMPKELIKKDDEKKKAMNEKNENKQKNKKKKKKKKKKEKNEKNEKKKKEKKEKKSDKSKRKRKHPENEEPDSSTKRITSAVSAADILPVSASGILPVSAAAEVDSASGILPVSAAAEVDSAADILPVSAAAEVDSAADGNDLLELMLQDLMQQETSTEDYNSLAEQQASDIRRKTENIKHSLLDTVTIGSDPSVRLDDLQREFPDVYSAIVSPNSVKQSYVYNTYGTDQQFIPGLFKQVRKNGGGFKEGILASLKRQLLPCNKNTVYVRYDAQTHEYHNSKLYVKICDIPLFMIHMVVHKRTQELFTAIHKCYNSSSSANSPPSLLSPTNPFSSHSPHSSRSPPSPPSPPSPLSLSQS